MLCGFHTPLLTRTRSHKPAKDIELMGTTLKKLLTLNVSVSLFIMMIRASSLVMKFVLTLFIARYLGFEALGMYGLIAAACVIAPSTVGFSFMYTISRKAVMLTQKEIMRELGYYFKLTILIYLVLCVATGIAGSIQGQLIFFLSVLALVFLEHLSTDIYTLLLNLSKPLAANVLHFIRSSVWMVVFMALAFFVPSLRTMETLIVLWAIGSITSLLCFIWVIRHWERAEDTAPVSLVSWFTNEFRESRTAYFTSFLRSIAQYLNHFLITIFLGIELTGIFVFYMQITSAMSNLLQTGIIQIAKPRLIRHHKSHNMAEYWNTYKQCLKHTVFTSLLMCCVAVPGIYVLTHHLIDKPLAIEWLSIFWWLLALFVVSNVSEVNKLLFYSQHRDDLLLRLFVMTFPVALVVNTILIYTLGLWGVIWSTLLLNIVGFMLQLKYARKMNNELEKSHEQ
tara:strand:+ start:610 stop:1965 length:1356 start_codon:yes stop_codon:yes gene_type:complete